VLVEISLEDAAVRPCERWPALIVSAQVNDLLGIGSPAGSVLVRSVPGAGSPYVPRRPIAGTGERSWPQWFLAALGRRESAVRAGTSGTTGSLCWPRFRPAAVGWLGTLWLGVINLSKIGPFLNRGRSGMASYFKERKRGKAVTGRAVLSYLNGKPTGNFHAGLD
jgi:hypothetical protein